MDLLVKQKEATMKRKKKESKQIWLMEFLSQLSTGKHNSGLFFRGRMLQSTWFGGVFTLVLAFFIISASVFTLISIFKMEQSDFIIRTESHQFSDFNISTRSAAEQLKVSFILAQIDMYNSTSLSARQANLSCNDFEVSSRIRVGNISYQKLIVDCKEVELHVSDYHMTFLNYSIYPQKACEQD